MEQTAHHVDNHTLLKQIKTHANTITSADLYTNTVGRTWQATAQADDRGCGPAFITIVVGLTPAINTSHPSALSRSLHTMHIIPLSQNRPRSTRKYAEIQTEHCVVACVPRIPPPLNTNHTHTISIIFPVWLKCKDVFKSADKIRKILVTFWPAGWQCATENSCSNVNPCMDS